MNSFDTKTMTVRARFAWACVPLFFGAWMWACSSDENLGPSTTVTLPDAGASAGSGGSASGAGGAPEPDSGGAGGAGPNTVDAGNEAAYVEAGYVAQDPRCASGTTDAGCSCALTTSIGILNQCTALQCQRYDNARIKNTLFVAGQPLPAVP